jgi:hypothetical protein
MRRIATVIAFVVLFAIAAIEEVEILVLNRHIDRLIDYNHSVEDALKSQLALDRELTQRMLDQALRKK